MRRHALKNVDLALASIQSEACSIHTYSVWDSQMSSVTGGWHLECPSCFLGPFGRSQVNVFVLFCSTTEPSRLDGNRRRPLRRAAWGPMRAASAQEQVKQTECRRVFPVISAVSKNENVLICYPKWRHGHRRSRLWLCTSSTRRASRSQRGRGVLPPLN